MADMLQVASRLTTDLRLRLPNEPREFVLRGLSHPTTDNMVVTEVDADFYHKWLDAFADYDPVQAGMIFELPAGFDATPKPKEYGFQPAFDRHQENADETKLAEEGVPEQPQTIGVGMAVPLPDVIPTPPLEVKRTVQQPLPQTVVKEETVKLAPVGPRPSMDNPNQDLNLAGTGGVAASGAIGTPAGGAVAPTPAVAPGTPPSKPEPSPQA